jgi:hypothetical protein
MKGEMENYMVELFGTFVPVLTGICAGPVPVNPRSPTPEIILLLGFR